MACLPIPDAGLTAADTAARLDRELRLAAGPVPTVLADALQDDGTFAATREAFVLSVAAGLRFHYRRGIGVRYASDAGIGASAVATFHEGSVTGAVAWMNGLVPLHASAVVWQGRVHAFAGASGTGKSTLTAALGQRGLVRFADDVVALDIASGLPVMALPGRKRLKLWTDAMAMTGLSGGERVWPGIDKFYVDDTPVATAVPLPLASLTLIEDDQAATGLPIVRLSGAGRLTALRDQCYRPDLRLREREASAFAQLATVAAQTPVFRFSRPRDASRFAEGVDRVMSHLEATFR